MIIWGKMPKSQHGNLMMERIKGRETCEKEFVEAYVQEGNIEKAVDIVYGDTIRWKSTKGRELLKRKTVREMLQERMVQKNATPDRAADAISDALDAERAVPSGDSLEWVADHSIRLRAADMTLKIWDAYPKPDKEEQSQISKHLHIHLQEPAIIQKFIVENQRPPTPEEREQLLGKLA